MPGIMQSSRMRSGSTLPSATHFSASLPDVSQCNCKPQQPTLTAPRLWHVYVCRTAR